MNVKELRKSVIEKREKLSKEEWGFNSKTIENALFSLGGFTDFSSYFVYRSFRGEVDTNGIIARLESLRKTLLYPVTTQDEMYAVKSEGNSFIKDKFGVDVPANYTFFSNPEVVIVPLVVCDTNCNRIGFGKGFYDRYLTNKSCLKIGICHDFQVLDKIEAQPWDVPLDIIITEKRVIYR